jgi:hypothetical protein
MAGCGEDDVNRITARTLEGVALHQAVAFEVTDYTICGTTPSGQG